MEAGARACRRTRAPHPAAGADRYARTATARQELASPLETLHRAECHKVFKEQISTRIKVRPELEAALALARQFKEAAPETPVIFTSGTTVWEPAAAVVFVGRREGTGPAADLCGDALNFVTGHVSAERWQQEHRELKGQILQFMWAERSSRIT
ncbi:organomercurial lyase [Streptomyces sp. NPDC046685]|uniref:organomercurial lyase n=1 Tax=Streptomyces sp. NPDC046685 TaxID=3157202 RepID=UPI00340D808D